MGDAASILDLVDSAGEVGEEIGGSLLGVDMAGGVDGGYVFQVGFPRMSDLRSEGREKDTEFRLISRSEQLVIPRTQNTERLCGKGKKMHKLHVASLVILVAVRSLSKVVWISSCSGERDIKQLLNY